MNTHAPISSSCSVHVTIIVTRDRYFQDVKVLAGRLPNVAERKVVPFPEFNHLDFLWANDVKNIVYDDMIGFMKRHDRKYADVALRPSAEVDANVVHADFIVSDVA